MKERIVLKREKLRVPIPDDPHTRLLPRFDICLSGERIGYISPGHAMLFKGHGKGHFAEALRRQEAFQRRLFRKGYFAQYKKDVVRGIGVHRNLRAFTIFINGLKTPTHIEFWRLPPMAAYFMKRGYALCEQSMRELQEHGLPKDATPEQVTEFLKTFKNAEYATKVLFVLTKPAQERFS